MEALHCFGSISKVGFYIHKNEKTMRNNSLTFCLLLPCFSHYHSHPHRHTPRRQFIGTSKKSTSGTPEFMRVTSWFENINIIRNDYLEHTNKPAKHLVDKSNRENKNKNKNKNRTKTEQLGILFINKNLPHIHVINCTWWTRHYEDNTMRNITLPVNSLYLLFFLINNNAEDKKINIKS